MRHRLSPLRYLVLGLALALFAPATTAWADARAEARVHYQAGVKAYNAGDYKAAIREFSQAQSLAPADLNNYNLALCYDRLGEAEPAIQYYRAYLDKVPGTDKRTEIEASIKRLEAAAKSAAAKRAEEERKAEEARKALEARRAEEARKAEAEARKAEEARRAEEGRRASEPDPRAGESGAGGGEPVGIGSTGTPSTGVMQPTGDAQLDRVQQLDVNAIRDQRIGGAGSGMADPRRGPSGRGAAGAVGAPGPEVGAAEDPNVAQTGPATSANGAPVEPPADKPKLTPVYKKWWFWAVVAVSAYVVYSIASEDSKTNRARDAQMFTVGGPQPAGGMTVFRF